MLGSQTSVVPRDEERHDGEQGREPKPDQVAPERLGDLASIEALSPGAVSDGACAGLSADVAHVQLPSGTRR